MLAPFTFIADLLFMAASLWLAIYLFSRGYPNRITMRAVLSLLALSMFFLGAYNNFFIQVPGTAALRAALLIIGMACWYSVTFQFLPKKRLLQLTWMQVGIYLLCFLAALLLLINRDSFVGEGGNNLYVAHMQGGLAYSFYGFMQVIVTASMLFNLLIDRRLRTTSQGKFLLFVSSLPILSVIYGIVALIVTEPPMPRLIQDALVFGGVFLLGISVARYQNLVERRTLLGDFPATIGIMFGLACIYACLALKIGLPLSSLGMVTALVIFTHGLYDLGREILERIRSQHESQFRKQLHALESESSCQDRLQRYLQEGLDLFCQTLDSVGGVVVICREGKSLVAASHNSAPVGNKVSIETCPEDEVVRAEGLLPNITWISSVFEGQELLALVGIGASKTKLEYSSGDLEFFTEFVDHVGTMISIGSLPPQTGLQIRQWVDESRTQNIKMQSAANNMLETLSGSVEADLVKLVEEALRKYSDFITLGQSPLADWLGVEPGSPLERGKQMQKILRESVDALRPGGLRPSEPLPRAWYYYAILHDAYLEGAPNRAVMTRLYISEGTFNRTRRSALRGVARWIEERFDAREQ
jgi:hypothetical protein